MTTQESRSFERARARLYENYVSPHTRVLDPDRVRDARDVIRYLPANRDATILELGCGPGRTIELLRQAGYGRVHGIDLSEEQVALATMRGVAGVECADLLEYLPGLPHAYDAIVALDLLEHFAKPDVLTVLELTRNALKPGGRFLARTPNAVSPFAGRYRYGDFTHSVSFTTRSLRQVLRTTGFESISFSPVSPRAHGVKSALRATAWQLIAGALKLVLAIETGDAHGHIVTQNLLVCATAPGLGETT